jgi:radical SAM protein with 4Fe4S-binding SPASM domain
LDAWIPLFETLPAPGPARNFAGCAASEEPSDAYEALLRRLRRDFTPYSVLWELTHGCNLRCLMCYNEPLAEPELTTAECFDILGQMAKAGTLRLILSGGEILTRRDFFAIASEARRLGFALDLKTNGTLITPRIADGIAALAPLQVDISLLGANNETSDAISGVRNAFMRVMRAVTLLRARGVRVKLNTLLMNLNLAEREQMLDLAQGLGVEYEQVLKISPSDTGATRAPAEQLSRGQMVEALRGDRTPFEPRERNQTSRSCAVGLSSCLISPYGIVYPCVELRIAAGDLRREPFERIWQEAPIFRELRDHHTLAQMPECRECALLSYCEGRCSGLSWKETGDLYRGHVLACHHAQARYEQQHPGASVPGTPFLAGQRATPTASLEGGG